MRTPKLNLGNLLKNGSFEQTKSHSGHLDPLWTMAHNDAYHIGLSTDAIEGTYSSNTAYADSATAGSYYWCLPINSGQYTAYAKFKSPVAGWYARLLMHCYNAQHDPNIAGSNQVFQQDFNIVANVWTECIFTFDAPDWVSLLHFSPRSTDSTLIVVDDCRLARGQRSVEEMRLITSVVPVVSTAHPAGGIHAPLIY